MKAKSQPMRTCVGCGESKLKKDLLRIVMNADGQIQVDTSGKAPGRGAYICPDLQCFETAYKGKKLERSFKRAVSRDVYEAVKAELTHE